VRTEWWEADWRTVEHTEEQQAVERTEEQLAVERTVGQEVVEHTVGQEVAGRTEALRLEAMHSSRKDSPQEEHQGKHGSWHRQKK
jgi:hypothetical protein